MSFSQFDNYRVTHSHQCAYSHYNRYSPLIFMVLVALFADIRYGGPGFDPGDGSAPKLGRLRRGRGETSCVAWIGGGGCGLD